MARNEEIINTNRPCNWLSPKKRATYLSALRDFGFFSDANVNKKVTIATSTNINITTNRNLVLTTHENEIRKEKNMKFFVLFLAAFAIVAATAEDSVVRDKSDIA